ncbi:MAG: xanthine phosphoribosyltransferase, partial [Clostridiales bacterium]|nr:xanthine phosphoribosyltransferase [Clostridiales bacterium]
IDIIHQANGHLVGVGICIEKGFQSGGDKLRQQGVHVKSLAIVDAIEDGKILLRQIGC